MQMLKPLSLVPVLLFALTASALAQQPADLDPFPVRGYLIGGGGASLNPQQSPSFTAEIAERVHRNVQVYVSVGYFYNLMSRSTRDQVAQVGRDLEEATGVPWVFDARDRGLSFTVGTKYLIPTGSQIRPYVGGGVGAINLRRAIREIDLGDVTEDFLLEFGVGDGVVDITSGSTTRPMGELAAGFNIVVGRAYLDVSYRFRKAFHTIERSFEFSQVGASAGVRF